MMEKLLHNSIQIFSLTEDANPELSEGEDVKVRYKRETKKIFHNAEFSVGTRIQFSVLVFPMSELL